MGDLVEHALQRRPRDALAGVFLPTNKQVLCRG
jgi:hypothetical protein